MHRPAVLTLNGGFKDFIITYLAVFAPRLHCERGQDLVWNTPSVQRPPSWSPPSPATLGWLLLVAPRTLQEWPNQPKATGH